MKTFWVVNPNSANGQTGRKWAELSAEISRGLGSFEHAFTERPMHAEALTRSALEKGAECIVAVGGDGTVNEVVNGFFRGHEPVRSGAALAVVPRGTGGDFRRTFGWTQDLADAIARIRAAKLKPMDVGLLRYTRPDGTQGERYFANICSFGASGVVDHEVNKSSKLLGGKVSFMLGSVKALMKYQDRTVRVSVDGGPKEAMPVTTLAVGNGRYFGGGMCVCPGADPFDGTFDVTVWSGYGLSDFALKSKAIYDGSHVKMKGTRTMRGTKIEAESDEEVLLDVDGEQPGKLPCSMTLIPGAIPLCI
jgi:YegS/Rv2252/BmrU family lipid kinase